MQQVEVGIDSLTEDKVADLIYKFESRKLSKTEWNHCAHLTVAIWYSFHYSFEEALLLIRKNIILYNESVGTPNTSTNGYHETLTRFWLQNVFEFVKSGEYKTISKACIDFINSPSGEKDYPLRYYSHALLFSVEARSKWVEPDLEPVPTKQENKGHYSDETT